MAYLKALHIIFVVTWFAGLFYMPRLMIYSTEAGERPVAERDVLRSQFAIMMKRLWYGITWPSAVITLVFGLGLLFHGWHRTLFTEAGTWITIKLGLVLGLCGYHLFLHRLTREMLSGRFRLTSMQLRVWNEVATVFLVAIVFLAVVRQGMSLVWGLGGLVVLMLVLMGGIGVYRRMRQ
jgi:protoporphyrinogen IX oxidase